MYERQGEYHKWDCSGRTTYDLVSRIMWDSVNFTTGGDKSVDNDNDGSSCEYVGHTMYAMNSRYR